LPIALDLDDPLQIALVGGIVALCVILIWIVRVIFRLGARSDSFGMWQPTYPAPPRVDPDTLDGRRYLWQAHAQNDGAGLTDMPCASGSVMARKLVVGRDGSKLADWRIAGARTGRYDAYGRIARTHHTLSGTYLSRLVRAARRRKVSPRAALRLARPIARNLVRDIVRHSDTRTAMLPIALDIRVKSNQPGARVRFDLLRCDATEWVTIDSWLSAPTIGSTGDAVDQLTYALYGQRFGETPRHARARLQADVTRIIAGVIVKPPVAKAAALPAAAPTAALTPPTTPVLAVDDTAANSTDA